MRIIFVFSWILFYVGFGHTQHPTIPYAPLVFTNTEPKWYNPIYIPSLYNIKGDGYNQLKYTPYLKPIFDGKFVYSSHKLISDILEWGAYIEKRNIETGEIVWSNYYFLPDIEYQELPRNWYIENEKLVILGLRRNKKFEVGDGLFCLYEEDARMTRRVYNTSSGQILEENNLTNADSSTQIVATEFPNSSFTNLFRTEDPNVYRYTERLVSNDTGFYYDDHRIRTFLLDKNGKMTQFKEDTIVLSNDFQQYHNVAQINGDTIVYVRQSNENLQKLTLYYYDPHFNILDSLNLEIPNHKLGYIIIDQFSPNYFTINSYVVLDTPFLQELFTYDVYNYQGMHLDGLKFDIFNGPYITGSINYIPTIKKCVFSAFSWQNNSKTINDILVSDSTGQLKLLKRINTKDTTRIWEFNKMYDIGNANLLCFTGEAQVEFENGFVSGFAKYAKAKGILVIEGKELGIFPTSTYELSNDIKATIFPNPTSSDLTFQLSEPISGVIEIQNIFGQTIIKETVNNIQYWSRDVSSIENGVYFIRIKSNTNKADLSLKFLKIE